jgi:DNA ligase-1
MKFLELVQFFERIEGISSRNDMALEMSDFLKSCNQQEAQILSYLMLGRVAPLFVNAEFNYSEKSLTNLLTEYTGKDIAESRREIGDIGDTVQKVWEEYAKEPFKEDILEIYEILWEIVNTKGNGSVQKKNKIVLECLKKLSPLESKYFVRIICGELRLGLNAKSLLDVFSVYLVGNKGMKDKLEHAYGVCADIGYISGIVVGDSPRTDLSNINIRLGTPILSRLVERVGSFDEVYERFKGSVIVQPKFDGLRCQIHKWSKNRVNMTKEDTVWSKYMNDQKELVSLFERDSTNENEVRLFTRNLEDVTEMFPEIVEAARNIPVDSFILDSEIVGWDYKRHTFLTYQETMQRRRKYSVGQKRESIPVKAFVFDILYHNSESLILKDTKERIELLEKEFSSTPEGIELADSKISNKKEDLVKYFKKYVSDGLEGVIVKQFEGGYKPGKRNFEWVKIKKSIDKELVDTVDMVIVGYYLGSGRRTDLGLGAILCGILNEKEDRVDAICKVGTGIDDSTLRKMSMDLDKIKLKSVPKNVGYVENLKPDVWVEPKYVVTVDADEITKNISKGNKEIGGGLSLRFPRLIEYGRDKLLEDITTVGELESMYSLRKSM